MPPEIVHRLPARLRLGCESIERKRSTVQPVYPVGLHSGKNHYRYQEFIVRQ